MPRCSYVTKSLSLRQIFKDIFCKMRLLSILIAIASVITTYAGGPASGNDCCNGLTLCVFGDSYVRNHRRPASETWHAKAAEALGMRYLNFGINGNAVAYDRSDRGFGIEMTRRYAELPDSVDVLLLIAGHNDAVMLAKDGNFSKFSNALDTLCTRLQRKYPDAAIGFVTPWPVNRNYFAEVIAEINRICALHGIEVFDAAKAGGIDVNDPVFREKYFQDKGVNDTAHLNSAGHDRLTQSGAAFIRHLIEAQSGRR